MHGFNMRPQLFPYSSRREVEDQPVAGDPPLGLKGLTKVQQVVIIVVVVCALLLLLAAPLYFFVIRRKERGNDPEAGGPSAAQGGEDNEGFVRRHLAGLRAWSKPAHLDKGKAPVREARGLDIDFDADRPASAERKKKLFKGKPREYYTHEILKKHPRGHERYGEMKNPNEPEARVHSSVIKEFEVMGIRRGQISTAQPEASLQGPPEASLR